MVKKISFFGISRVYLESVIEIIWFALLGLDVVVLRSVSY